MSQSHLDLMAFYFAEHWLGPQCCLKPVPSINTSLSNLKSKVPKKKLSLPFPSSKLFLSLFELQVCHYRMLCWGVYKGQPWTPGWSLAELIQTSVLHLPVCLTWGRCLTSKKPASIQLGSQFRLCSSSEHLSTPDELSLKAQQLYSRDCHLN